MAAEKDDSRIVPVHFCRVTVIFLDRMQEKLNEKMLRDEEMERLRK